jgi:hypothetical protein
LKEDIIMKSAFYFMLIVMVLVAIGFVAFYIQSSDKVTKLEDQLASAVSQVTSIAEERDSANAEALDLTVQLSVLEQENAGLQETIKPTKPTHNISPGDLTDYWNIAYDDAMLQQMAREVNSAYHEWHYYIAGETDCNDMAVDIWDMLRKKCIISLIAYGNIDMDDESWAKCNHVWIVILSSSGKTFALEPTNGQLYFKGDAIATQYMENFLYAWPSDLRADLGSRW